MNKSAIHTRPLKHFTVQPSGGLDASANARSEETARASFCRNLYRKEDGLHKRPGWRQTAKLPACINGVWCVPNEEALLLVHAGTHFYTVNTAAEPWVYTDITDAAPPAYRSSQIANQKSRAFQSRDRLYITSCGDYLVFGKWSNTYQIRRVYGNEDTTAPLTAHRAFLASAFDENAEKQSNLLSPWRRNTLQGFPKLAASNEAYELYYWILDTSVDADTAVTLTFSDRLNQTHTLTFAGNETVKNAQTLPADAYGSCVAVHLDRVHGQLWFYRPVSDTELPLDNRMLICFPTDSGVASADLPVDAENLLTVRFSHTPAELIGVQAAGGMLTASGGVLYTAETNVPILCLSGIGDFSNIEYRSCGTEDDFTYFPLESRLQLGSGSGTITGFSRLNDNTLAVFYEQIGLYQGQVFYQKPDGSFKAELLREMPLATRAIVSFNGDPLLLSENGVFALTPNGTATNAERRLYSRGRAIAALLAKDGGRSEAEAAVLGERYYLAVGDHVYVADLHCRRQYDGQTNSTAEYEWWYWDSVPVRVFGEWEKRLLFGTQSGMLCVFDDAFCDRTYQPIEAGMLAIHADTGTLTVSNTLSLAPGDTLAFYPASMYARLYAQPSTAANGVFAIPESWHVFPDGTALAATGLTVDGVLQPPLSTVYSADCEGGSRTFALTDAQGTPIVPDSQTAVQLYLPLDGKTLRVASVQDGTVTLAADAFSDVLFLAFPSVLPLSLSGKRLHSEPVCAHWTTPFYSPGGAQTEKSLRAITVTIPPTGGEVRVGWQTEKAGGTLQANNKPFSFADASFSALTFTCGVGTHTRHFLSHRFHFVRFVCENTQNADFCMPQWTVSYVELT